MAITKKALAIQQEKAGLREKHRALFDRMKQACGKVPEAVMRGDATLAVKWRDAAEAAHREGYTLSGSLTPWGNWSSGAHRSSRAWNS